MAVIPFRFTEQQGCYPLGCPLPVFVSFSPLYVSSHKILKLDLSFPDWELSLAFEPLQVHGHQTSWVTRDGRPVRPARGFTANSLHLYPEFINLVTRGSRLADADMLAFRDSDAFVAGSLHHNLPT